MSIRIDSLLSQSGVVARRKVSEFLTENTVTVDDVRITSSGTRVEASQTITINGVPLKSEKKIYLAYHKPVGVVSTVADELGRKTAVGQVASEFRIYPVGRLDKDTSGLLLLTNDGELTYRLTHPRFHVPKVYRVKCKGFLSQASKLRLANGIPLKHGRAAKAGVTVLEPNPDPVIELEVIEGRNHLIRRMCKAVNLEVVSLVRKSIGPLRLDLGPGEYRPLTQEELISLVEVAGLTLPSTSVVK